MSARTRSHQLDFELLLLNMYFKEKKKRKNMCGRMHDENRMLFASSNSSGSSSSTHCVTNTNARTHAQRMCYYASNILECEQHVYIVP